MSRFDVVAGHLTAERLRAEGQNGNKPSDLELPWTPVDVGAVLRGERVTAPPSVLPRKDGPCLLYRGRTNAFLGETESLKTWAELVTAAEELAQGQHVVMLDYEDTVEAAVERLVALGVKPAAIATKFTYINPEGRFDDIAKGVIEEAIERRGQPSLVLVDSVTEAMTHVGLNPDKGIEVTAFYAGFPRFFARLGAAVLLTDHVTKDREGRGRWAIGSERKISGLTGAAYSFDPITTLGRGRTGRVKLTVSKDRPGHVRQYEGAGRAIAVLELESWPDGKISAHLLPPQPGPDPDKPFRPTVVMEKVSRLLEDAAGPLSKRAIRTQAGGKATVVDTALELLAVEGFVAVEDGPNRSTLHRSKRPFRAGQQST